MTNPTSAARSAVFMFTPHDPISDGFWALQPEEKSTSSSSLTDKRMEELKTEIQSLEKDINELQAKKEKSPVDLLRINVACMRLKEKNELLTSLQLKNSEIFYEIKSMKIQGDE